MRQVLAGIAGVLALCVVVVGVVLVVRQPTPPAAASPVHQLARAALVYNANVVRDQPIASTGCGQAPFVAPGSSGDTTLEAGGLLRTYRVHVPTGYRPTQPYALLLSLHGNGSSDVAQERITGFSTLADQDGFIAVYPQGTTGPNGRTGWSSEGPGHPTVNDVLFVSDVLTTLQARLCIDPHRIYATGFSNGGAMTSVLACRLALRIAAFATVSGSYYPQHPACTPGRPVPLLEVHGTGDTIVPYAGRPKTHLMPVATWLAGWAQRDGCPGSAPATSADGPFTTTTWGPCGSGVMLMHVRIAGGQHVWPSLLPVGAGPRAGVGRASAVIWHFLSAYTLPSSSARATSVTAATTRAPHGTSECGQPAPSTSTSVSISHPLLQPDTSLAR